MIFETITWPGAILAVGLIIAGVFLFGGAMASWHEFRKLKITAEQEEALRQLVARYEQLAEKSLDAQQRMASDLAEMRTRTDSIERILRTVE